MYWMFNFMDLQALRKLIHKLNVAFVMRNIFQLMMNLVLRVEVALIVHVKITAAVGPSTVFALEIGCVPSQQQDSHLMFYSGIVHTVLIQLLSKSILGSKEVSYPCQIFEII